MAVKGLSVEIYIKFICKFAYESSYKKTKTTKCSALIVQWCASVCAFYFQLR